MQGSDAIVVGTGGIGAAAAFHLAARGVRVIGIDRFPPVHDRGSSHGHTRLIRRAYFEHPDYVPLLIRAYELWRELEQAAGHPLLVESGLLMGGPPDGDVVQGVLRSAGIHRLPIERMTPDEVAARWPAIRLPADWTAVYEADAGYLFVEECVRAHLEAARRAGARFEHGVVVRSWRAGAGGGVTVETDRGTFAADRLVLTPGPWATGLLRLPWLPLKVLRKSLFWYSPGPSVANHPLPCFAFDTPTGFFYGFPPLDDRGLKIAEHTGGRPVADPLDVDPAIDPAEQARIEAALADHLPDVGRRCVAHKTCLYTMSPDGHFAVGTHPDEPRVAIAAGFSGHGFKFASVMGEILADIVLGDPGGRRDPHPIGFLSPARFAGP
jgi:sarcosine oxidase